MVLFNKVFISLQLACLIGYSNAFGQYTKLREDIYADIYVNLTKSNVINKQDSVLIFINSKFCRYKQFENPVTYTFEKTCLEDDTLVTGNFYKAVNLRKSRLIKKSQLYSFEYDNPKLPGRPAKQYLEIGIPIQGWEILSLIDEKGIYKMYDSALISIPVYVNNNEYEYPRIFIYSYFIKNNDANLLSFSFKERIDVQ